MVSYYYRSFSNEVCLPMKPNNTPKLLMEAFAGGGQSDKLEVFQDSLPDFFSRNNMLILAKVHR